MLSTVVNPRSDPMAGLPPRMPNKNPANSLFCFPALTNAFPCKPFPFTFIRKTPGVGSKKRIPSETTTFFLIVTRHFPSRLLANLNLLRQATGLSRRLRDSICILHDSSRLDPLRALAFRLAHRRNRVRPIDKSPYQTAHRHPRRHAHRWIQRERPQ